MKKYYTGTIICIVICALSYCSLAVSMPRTPAEMLQIQGNNVPLVSQYGPEAMKCVAYWAYYSIWVMPFSLLIIGYLIFKIGEETELRKLASRIQQGQPKEEGSW